MSRTVCLQLPAKQDASPYRASIVHRRVRCQVVTGHVTQVPNETRTLVSSRRVRCRGARPYSPADRGQAGAHPQTAALHVRLAGEYGAASRYDGLEMKITCNFLQVLYSLFTSRTDRTIANMHPYVSTAECIR